MLLSLLSLYVWVERPHYIDNPKNLPEIQKSQAIYRQTNINDYAAMVRDGEMPKSFPIEARKAQEVLARSYYLSRPQQYIRSTDLFQVFSFDNFIKTLEPSLILENVKNLEYHSRCPGYVITDGKIVFCPLHQAKPYIWKTKINPSDNDFTSTVRKILLTQNLDEKRKLRLPFRKQLPSVFLDDFNIFTGEVTGKGYGHGHGLCQWGAKYLAEQGLNFKEILKLYYPNGKLTKYFPSR